MAKVTYISSSGASQTVDVEDGETVMRGAMENGIDGIIAECGGGLACATCHCYVDDAWADKTGTPTSQDERDMLEMTACEIKSTSRLSCQIDITEALDGLVVHLPEAQY
ncbi:2Fe-2S iron-sulfur cluster-binding protein [Erythrobacter alti]|uniref:2Fe-2S iron-sulfur cluster-binding protein n=1 Tax=Erythrobacter alti TaxID=1896145 RepID=UPI0030F44622